MSSITATDRMARLVAAIPWIVSQDGASVDEIAERFDYPREILLDDLRNVVFFVGVPPYTPDTLIEVQIDDDMVWIDYADWFARPMKLNSGEALALLTAGETVLGFDSQDEAGALARGLTKLRLATGATSDALEVELGVAAEDVLRDLRRAVADGVCVDISYYSFARNERTARRIEPTRFFSEDGKWYVAAYCHLAEGDRLFRLDRIESVDVTSVPADPSRASGADDQPFSIDESPRATVRIPLERRQLIDQLPVDNLEVDENEEILTVTLPASSARWLERLVVRAGPGAALTAMDGDLAADPTAAIERILTRYPEFH